MLFATVLVVGGAVLFACHRPPHPSKMHPSKMELGHWRFLCSEKCYQYCLNQGVCREQATGGIMERAVDWLFSHADDMDTAVAAVQKGSNALSGTTMHTALLPVPLTQ